MTAHERRVYVLPTELLERIRSYQQSQGIASEVEAARRLLDRALLSGDTVQSILGRLQAAHRDRPDLRALSAGILALHPLVRLIQISDDVLSFTMTDGDGGMIKRSGAIATFSTPTEGAA